MPQLPDPIRLGGRDWSFALQPELAGAAGVCWRAASHIDILDGQHPVDEADSIVHEVFHAILYCQGRPDGGKVEETYVRALATGLITVLKDNPKFASWLLGTTT